MKNNVLRIVSLTVTVLFGNQTLRISKLLLTLDQSFSVLIEGHEGNVVRRQRTTERSENI